MVPVVFRSPRSLTALNIAGVGFAIAAMTTAVLTLVFGGPSEDLTPLVVGLPSLAVGATWAAVLRRRDTVTAMRWPIGWVLSIPLAALNAGLACALLMLSTDAQIWSLVGGLFLGATFGVVIWLPALVVVLVLFGVPIAQARKLARLGLAGEERGERGVGLACAASSVAAVALSTLSPASHLTGGRLLFYAFAWFGVVSGGGAMWLAIKRERMRRRFVARVEAEEIPGMRIEERPEGKVLVRIESQIATYRLPAIEDEEVFELAHDGSAVRPIPARDVAR